METETIHLGSIDELVDLIKPMFEDMYGKSKMTDMIIGAIDNLTWDQIKYWCNSIDKCGFTGCKIVVAMNITKQTFEELDSRGFDVVMCGTLNAAGDKWDYTPQLTVHVERFAHIWNFLRTQEGIRNVVMTDVRDVVFQRDPCEFVGDSKKLFVGSECIAYEDEPWGNQNLLQTFGKYFHEIYKNREIYNVGVIGGPFDLVRDLANMIYQMSINRPIPIVDQAVFNFLMWHEPWASVTNFCKMSDGWAIHCGTVADPKKIEEFRPHWTESFEFLELPELVPGDQYAREVFVTDTNTGSSFPSKILHQWDRVPLFREFVEKKYG